MLYVCGGCHTHHHPCCCCCCRLLACLARLSADRFPQGGPGRGGPWWNDPTYWLGLALGLGLAWPLVNRYVLNRTSDKERVSGAATAVAGGVHCVHARCVCAAAAMLHARMH